MRIIVVVMEHVIPQLVYVLALLLTPVVNVLLVSLIYLLIFFSFSDFKYKTKDLCDSNDCSSHGTCNRATGICECNAGYSGNKCQISM